MTDTHAAASAAVDAAAALVDGAARHLASAASDNGRISVSKLDEHQVVAYDLAHAAAAVEGSRVMLQYAEHGELEANLAYAYIADAFADIVSRLVGREAEWGVDPAQLSGAHDFVAAHRDPAFLERLADELPRHGTGPAHLDDEFDMVRDTFHRFAEDKIRPVAEHIHRTNADIPAEIIDGMAEIGGFG
ncbi:MAG: acyl-CoA dehydrogenase family protein, partial [Acidimicrobiia bacterium]|nr:acyl-CoA dehydrogenase family protein [Acidimicrobiia bacterium]